MPLSRRDLLKTGTSLALAPALASWNLSTAAADERYADAVLVDGEPPKPEKGSFTMAVLPDTQLYSEKFPENFKAQTQWIVDNRQARNIAGVLHLGDITNHNTPEQWERATAALDILEGKVPCFFVPGNHDYSQGGRCTDRTTLLNDYLSHDKIRQRPTFGGTYDKEPGQLENSYHLFSAGGRDYLVLGLEFGPRKDVVRWANEVAAKHADRAAILITHAFIYHDDTRYNWEKYGPEQKWNPHSYGVAKATDDDVTDGEELWNMLLSKHENFILAINGHVLYDGLGRVTSQTPAGRNVHQMLVNYQMRPNGGDGWLRLLEFRPDGKTVQVYDYSPILGKRNESEQNQFALQLSPPKVS